MSSMKKILIVSNNLTIGGVQKALINLLWNIRKRYDVTLLLLNPSGAYMDKVPPEVKIISARGDYRYLATSRKEGKNFSDYLKRAFYAAITRICGRKYAVALMKIGQQRIAGFDIAVSYIHNGPNKAFYGGCNEFLLKHVSAKKKIAFLHGDFTLFGANTRENKKQYAQFDRIAACSQGCADAFMKVNPDMAHKVMVVENCHRFEQIHDLASEASISLDPEKINLVIVSRFGKEKSVERALLAIAGLGSMKEKIHLFIIGDGVQKPKILEILEQERLQPWVTLCGELENPYGYMQAADLLLIPSRSEAAPMVIGEAACLGTPILSMKTSSAEEMIANTGFGWVCENNVEAMTEALKELIGQPHRLEDVARHLKLREFSNENALAQFQKCLE